MSCDLEVTNGSARCWEEISSYVTLFLVQLKPFFFFLQVKGMMKNLNRESDQYIQVSCDVSQHQLEMYLMESEKNAGATVAQASQSFSR